MLQILTMLGPVFLVILLGHALYRLKAIEEPGWAAFDQLCYYLLFPALVIRTVATVDFSGISVGRLILGFFLALLAATLLLIGLKRPLSKVLGLNDAGFTSLFQGCTRWHGFMALAMVTAVYGTPGVAIVAVALAALVPALNMINVAVLAAWGETGGAARPGLVGQIARNPFIIACAIGALLNVTGLGLGPPLLGMFQIVGDCALGISLLTIGAGLRPLKASRDWAAIGFGVAFRLLLMPAIFFLCLSLAGIDGPALTVGVICGAVPTAASSYVLARKMGGDAPLMANLTSAQVLAAFVTLPLVIWVLG